MENKPIAHRPTAIVSAVQHRDFTEYNWVDIKTGKDVLQPSVSAMEYSVALESLKNISGKMLTFIEATMSDQEQRKASKDIIKGFFSEEMSRVSSLCFSTDWMTPTVDPSITDEELEKMSVDIEDIIKGKV